MSQQNTAHGSADIQYGKVRIAPLASAGLSGGQRKPLAVRTEERENSTQQGRHLGRRSGDERGKRVKTRA